MKTARRIRIYGPLTLYGIFLLLPFYWMVLTTFKSREELLNTANPFWVFHGTFSHVVELLTTTAYLQWFANTLFVSAASTVKAGEPITLTVNHRAMHAFDPATGESIGVQAMASSPG